MSECDAICLKQLQEQNMSLLEKYADKEINYKQQIEAFAQQTEKWRSSNENS